MQKKAFTEKQIENYCEELLQFMGTINWDQEGISLEDISDSHPFKPVFDAIAMTKRDVDNLFQQHKRVVTELLEKQSILKEQNINLVSKSIELSGIMRELEEINYDIELSRADLKKTLAALQESENKYRTLLEYIPQKIFHKDRDSVYISCNENYAWDLNIKPEEIEGKTDYEFFPKELAEKYRADDKRIIASGRTEDIEEKYIQDGQERYVQTVKTPIKDEEGNITGVLGVFWDITKRKQAEAELLENQSILKDQNINLVRKSIELSDIMRELEDRNYDIELSRADLEKTLAALRESEERFRSLAESTSDWVWEVDVNAAYTYASPKVKDLLGYEPDEVIGKRPFDFVTADQAEQIAKFFKAVVDSRKPFAGLENTNIHKDGRHVVLETSGVPILDAEGNFFGYRGIDRDITERKRMETLQQAKIEAEAANRAKSDFLAKMSHEIRTPLNPIIGMTHLAMNLDISPKLQNYLTIIQTSAHTLLGIINDILDFSKIEAGKLDLETVDFQLRDVLEHLGDMFRDKTAEKGIEMIMSIDHGVPCALIGDPLRLGQILMNLTSNAIKFTERGEVIIKVTCLEESAERVRLGFSVKDTGIGIPPEYITKLFTPFTQVDGSTTRRYGGTGLGLTISKRLVDMMDGEIGAESKLGQGSTFRFTASFGRQSEDEEQEFIAPSFIQELKVLVVDDNENLRIALGDILRSFTFEVDTASCGEEGLEKLRQNLTGEERFGLVLMDSEMPGLSGIAASKKIKEDPQLAQIPIIMMTPFGRDEEIRGAETMGVEAFLIKPLMQSQLFNTIMDLFGEMKLEDTQGRYRAVAGDSVIMDRIRGAKILLVEDNPINREVALEILANAGIVVETAENGKEAVEAVHGTPYDCVLMDIEMPGMDGFEATRVIRKNEEQLRVGNDLHEITEPATRDPQHATHIPIIAITAHAMKGDRYRCMEAGMDDYVVKPIDPDALFSTLGKWIKPEKRHTDIVVPVDHHEAERVEQDLTAMLPGIYIEQGLRRLNGNKKLFKKLLEAFSAEFASVTEEIRAALNSQDMEVAYRLAHTIKGVSGNIAAEDLRAAAQELALAIKEGSPGRCNILLGNLEKALSQVLESIRSLGCGAGSEVGD